MKMNQKDLMEEIKNKTGYYKTDIKTIMDALESILVEKLSMATGEDDVEIKLFNGFVIGSKFVPERDAVDPRDQSPIKIHSKIKPNVKLSGYFKNNIQ